MNKGTAIIMCPKCGKVKKFGAWLRPPPELVREIETGEVQKISIVCDVCTKGEISNEGQ